VGHPARGDDLRALNYETFHESPLAVMGMLAGQKYNDRMIFNQADYLAANLCSQ
jgi:hypothetical protein